MPGIPFVGSLYDYSRGPGANISNLLLERGRAQADSAARIGQIWGNTIASLGQLPRQMQEDKFAQQKLANETAITEARKQELEQHAHEREQDIAAQAERKKAEQALFTKIHSGEPVKVEDFYQTYGKDGFAAFKSYQEAQSPKPDARTLMTGLGMASDEYLQHSWPVLQPQISKALGVPPEAIPQWDRAKYDEFMQAQGWAKAAKEDKKYQVTVPGPDNQPMHKLVTEDELSKGVVGYKAPPASAALTPSQQDDTKTLAQQLVDGRSSPSQYAKRGKEYNHILAEADRMSQEQTGKKLNINKLQLDYESAKRFASSLNAPQMVRFKGLGISVVNTIDEVNKLADELKQGGIQKWNQAKRNTFLQVYGNTPESDTAARYVAAVNTLKEEFANLAQGGYAPTEDAWKLANTQINEDYGFKDLQSSVSEVQRLINYRLNAFNEISPMYLGGGPGQNPQPQAGGGPKPGDVVDGFEFKGGDPNDENSWEKR